MGCSVSESPHTQTALHRYSAGVRCIHGKDERECHFPPGHTVPASPSALVDERSDRECFLEQVSPHRFAPSPSGQRSTIFCEAHQNRDLLNQRNNTTVCYYSTATAYLPTKVCLCTQRWCVCMFMCLCTHACACLPQLLGTLFLEIGSLTKPGFSRLARMASQ